MSPRLRVIKLLERLEKSDVYADILLTRELRNAKLTGQDKAFIQELFYGVIRWRVRLDWIIQDFFRGSFSKSPRFVKYILQVSFYQLIFLKNIPTYAVINEAVRLAKKRGGIYWGNKINAILRKFTREEQSIVWPDARTKPAKNIAVRFSHPLWLVERWISQWGIEETEALCQTNNQIPAISVRVNRLKTTTEKLVDIFEKAGIKASVSDFNSDFLLLKRLPDVENFEPFQKGLFTIQDVSAGFPCLLLDPKPGEKIIDLCSAPGGKATYLAELSSDRGAIVAADRNFSRLNLVSQNKDRLKLKFVHLLQADGINFYSKQVDKVLVDAPCSGLGVLAKRVDLRWKRTISQIDELRNIQLNLLRNAADLVRPGGVIVYCTCTIEPDENERVVADFLAENKKFRIEDAAAFIPKELTQTDGFIKTFPHRHGMDGSFAARLIKKSER